MWGELEVWGIAANITSALEFSTCPREEKRLLERVNVNKALGVRYFPSCLIQTNKLSEASKHFHHWFSTSSARESVTSGLQTKPHQGLRSLRETARISLSCWSNCRGSLNDEYVEMPIWVTRAATNGIMQGLSFSLCLYSAYNQGTWPSWLPLETAAIQITNKNNGIKSE